MSPSSSSLGGPSNQKTVSLRLTTFNINGLGNASKRRAVFNYLRKQNNNIICLQETHSTRDREKIWTSEWGGGALFAHGTAGSRGVAILFSPSLPIDVREVLYDSAGRYIILHASLDSWPLTLVNDFAPTADHPDHQEAFLGDLESLLQNAEVAKLLIGGDLNCCLDLPRSASKLNRNGTTVPPSTPTPLTASIPHGQIFNL